MLAKDAIRARCEAATPGPWTVRMYHSGRCGWKRGYQQVWNEEMALSPEQNGHVASACQRTDSEQAWPENAAFIAAARADVPLLLDECERLEKKVQEADAVLRQASLLSRYSILDLASAIAEARNILNREAP